MILLLGGYGFQEAQYIALVVLLWGEDLNILTCFNSYILLTYQTHSVLHTFIHFFVSEIVRT